MYHRICLVSRQNGGRTYDRNYIPLIHENVGKGIEDTRDSSRWPTMNVPASNRISIDQICIHIPIKRQFFERPITITAVDRRVALNEQLLTSPMQRFPSLRRELFPTLSME
jgi:hypothetical protein